MGPPSVRQRWRAASPLARLCAAALFAVALAHPAIADRGVVGASLGAVLLVAAVALARGPGDRLPRRLTWPASAWLVGLLISAVAGGSWSAPALLPPVLGVGALFVGWRLAAAADADAVIVALGAAAVVAAIQGVAQHMGWDPMPRVDRFPNRVVGPFANPNHLGSFAAVCLPLLWAVFLRACTVPGGPRRRPAAVVGVAALLVYCVALLAGSRGALWAAFAGGVVVLAGYVRAVLIGARGLRLAGPLMLAMAMVCVTALLHTRPIMEGPGGEVSVGQRLEAMSNVAGEAAALDLTVAHRRVLWRAAGRLFADQPWLGVGPGRFAVAGARALEDMTQDPDVALLLRERRLEVPPHAHSEALHFGAESGVVGLLPLVCLVGFGLGGGMVAGWSSGTLGTWGAIGACSTVLVHGLVSYPLHLPLTASVFWILLGILFKLEENRRDVDKSL